jgi:signal peptidase I
MSNKPRSSFTGLTKNIGNILFFTVCGLLVFIVFCQMGLVPLRFMFIRSGSMRPSYEPGDLAVVYVGKNIEVNSGDVVLFSASIGPTIHRVIAVENGLITTKGDANDAPDISKIKQVDGKVWCVLPKLGYAIDFLQTAFQSIVQVFTKS